MAFSYCQIPYPGSDLPSKISIDFNMGSISITITISTIRQIKFINKHKFVKASLEKNLEKLITYCRSRCFKVSYSKISFLIPLTSCSIVRQGFSRSSGQIYRLY